MAVFWPSRGKRNMQYTIVCCSLKCESRVLQSVLNDHFYYHYNSRALRGITESGQLRHDDATLSQTSALIQIWKKGVFRSWDKNGNL